MLCRLQNNSHSNSMTCSTTKNCLNCAKLRLNILEEEYGDVDVETGRLRGHKIPFHLGVWGGRRSENWVGTGYGQIHQSRLDFLYLTREVGSFWVWGKGSTPHYKWFRKAKKEVSFNKVFKVCGPERRLRGFRKVSLPLLRKADYQGEKVDR